MLNCVTGNTQNIWYFIQTNSCFQGRSHPKLLIAAKNVLTLFGYYRVYFSICLNFRSIDCNMPPSDGQKGHENSAHVYSIARKRETVSGHNSDNASYAAGYGYRTPGRIQ